jgi:hypothetical protein
MPVVLLFSCVKNVVWLGTGRHAILNLICDPLGISQVSIQAFTDGAYRRMIIDVPAPCCKVGAASEHILALG